MGLAVVAAWFVEASACSVPVYRYALERWRPDPYMVVIFHRGELDAKHQKMVDNFRAYEGVEKVANLRVLDVDLDKLQPEMNDEDRFLSEEWKRQKTDVLPWVVIDYPVPTKNRLYEGPLSAFVDKKAVAELVDSPARQELKKRILGNHTGVFLLLECSNKEANDAAAKLIEAQIPKLQKELKLPEIDPNDVKAGLISVDPDQLQIKFSMLRLKRDATVEKWFVKMLLGSDSDFNLFEKEFDAPIMFPVFGRGRSLPCLIEQGIVEERIVEVGMALTQSCTCEIKNQNPGIDLLMAVNWDELVEIREVDQELPPLLGLGQFVGPGKQKGPNDVKAVPNAGAQEDGDAGIKLPANGPEAPESEPRQVGDDKAVLAVGNAGDKDKAGSTSAAATSESASNSRSSDQLAGKVSLVAIVGGIIVVLSTVLVATRRG